MTAEQADAEWAAYCRRNSGGGPSPHPLYATRFTVEQMRAGHLAYFHGNRSSEVRALERAYSAWRHRVQRERRRREPAGR